MSVLIRCKACAWNLMHDKPEIPDHNRSVIERVLVTQVAAQALGMNAAALRCDEFLALLLTEDAMTLRGNVPQSANPWAGLNEASVTALKEKSDAYMAELDC